MFIMKSSYNKDYMSQKKLPKSIKIGYANFKLRHVAKKSLKVEDLGEMEFSPNHVLRIFGKQNNSELANTLVHEISHAINYVFNIEFKNAKEEEKFVRQYTNGLVTVLRDNPGLLDLLKIYLQPEN